jgi:catechol 2,3-dioxygenase-like lactoylglutathione lyase family enzyme
MLMDAISHVAIEVADLTRAKDFYRLLGFEFAGDNRLPECGRNAMFRTASGQGVILCESSQPRSLPETGVHQAYRISPFDRDALARELANYDVTVHNYEEDRPSEKGDNFYFYDPDGNRIQLLASTASVAERAKMLAIDHAAVECHDLEWAEDFYVKKLGLTVDHRVGWRTDDYVRAKLWGEGKENMAPGTRRWDQRYTVMEQKRRLPRPNTHFFVRLGDQVLGIYLATQHRQEPPEEQVVGTPRIGLRADRRAILEITKLLAANRTPIKGPVEHSEAAPIAASLYVRDPGGNFLEICVPR